MKNPYDGLWRRCPCCKKWFPVLPAKTGKAAGMPISRHQWDGNHTWNEFFITDEDECLEVFLDTIKEEMKRLDFQAPPA